VYKKIILIVFVGLVVFSAIYALTGKKKVTTNSDKAYQLYLAGEELTRKLYYSDAIPKFEKAIKIDTNFAMAYAMLANMYYMFDEKDNAMKLIDKAVLLFPKITEKEQLIINNIKGVIYNDMEFTEKNREKMIQKYPKSLEGYQFKASDYQMKHDFVNAIKEYEQLLKNYPDYALAYNMLGYLNYYQRNFDKAITNIKKYSIMAGKQANPHDSYGEILMYLGRYDEAIKEFEKANKIKPDLYFVLNHLGDVYREIGRFRDAIGYYERARDMATNKLQVIEADIEIAFTFWRENKNDKALNILDEALDFKIGCVSSIILKGNALMLQGIIWAQNKEFEKAIANLDSIESLMANDELRKDEGKLNSIQIYRTLLSGTIALNKKDYNKAIDDFQFLIDNSQLPSVLWFRQLLGNAYNLSGNFEKAKECYMANLADNSNHPLSLFQLAQVYKNLGDIENQKQMLLKFLSVTSGADESFVDVIDARKQLDSLVQLQIEES